MAAYEVLLLNTSIPQIQAAQTGDTYVVPRDIAFNAGVTVGDASGDAFTINSSAVSIPNGLNFDSNTFVIDAANDRVGIGTATPAGKLTVKTGTNENLSVVTGGSGDMRLSALNDAGSTTVQLSIQASPLYFRGTGGSVVATIDSSGNLGLGVTPSAWGSPLGSAFLEAKNGMHFGSIGTSVSIGYIGVNSYYNGSNWIYKNSTYANRYELNSNNSGAHAWFTAASGTAGNAISFTQAMTLDASGNLGIGETNPGARLHVDSGSTGNYAIFKSTNANGGYAAFYSSSTVQGDIGTAAQIVSGGAATDFGVNARGSRNLIFGTNNAERARITSGGYFKASDNGTYLSSTGTYYELNQSANDNVLFIRSTSTAYSVDGVQLRFNRNTTNNTFYALSYYNEAAAAYKFRIADSGDVTNTNGSYGTISDAKMKTDIVDAGSQWSDIKAIRFRKFKMKDDPSGLVQLGVVAQEVEQTSPGLVDEHADKDAEGNDLGTTTKSVKTSVLLMKAAVALQEAMARIEQLEAKVAAMGA